MDGAVIHDAQESIDQVLSMLCDKRMPTIDGKRLSVKPATVCINGDTPGAATTARALRKQLMDAGIAIAPFANPDASMRRRPFEPYRISQRRLA